MSSWVPQAHRPAVGLVDEDLSEVVLDAQRRRVESNRLCGAAEQGGEFEDVRPSGSAITASGSSGSMPSKRTRTWKWAMPRRWNSATLPNERVAPGRYRRASRRGP